jgi:hypothetical protein
MKTHIEHHPDGSHSVTHDMGSGHASKALEDDDALMAHLKSVFTGHNVRPILTDPIGPDGLFAVPEKITAEDEVRYAKRRQDSERISQYADSHCGLPNTFDKDGGYLCGGRQDGGSVPCNKLDGIECLIRIKPINDKHHQSCGMWEVANAGDPEGRYCPKGKLDDARIGFGGTKSPLGFSCQRCEYSAEMEISDSEGRDDFCRLKGHPVEDNACCEDNEPVSVGS